MLIRLHDVNILITMNVLIKITLLSIVTFLKISRLRLPRRMFRDFADRRHGKANDRSARRKDVVAEREACRILLRDDRKRRRRRIKKQRAYEVYYY